MLFQKCIAAIATSVCLVPLGTLAAVLAHRGELVLTNGALVQGEANWNWEDCGASDSIVQIQSLEVSPEPQPGRKVNVTIEASVNKVIEDGAYADVVVKLGLIKLLKKTFDLCEEARNANATVQCPVKAGQHKLTQEVELPKEIPPAKFTVATQAYTVEDEDLFCNKIVVDFLPKRPSFSMD